MRTKIGYLRSRRRGFPRTWRKKGRCYYCNRRAYTNVLLLSERKTVPVCNSCYWLGYGQAFI